jgi:nitroimidazol reductase NimA-like FMN-containing flavoprotein (pyridoxamine 5'-phosphate oxidase superfamily)
MVAQPPRGTEQRKHDTLARLERDVDAWVASADSNGNAYLVPLSYVWDSSVLIMATLEANELEGRDLMRDGDRLV